MQTPGDHATPPRTSQAEASHDVSVPPPPVAGAIPTGAPHSAASPAPDVRAAAMAMARELGRSADSLEKAARQAAKSIKALGTAGEWDDPSSIVAAALVLEKFELPADFVTRAREVAALTRRSIGEEDRRLRMTFTRELREAASTAGFETSVLTSDPPEFRVGPFTVVCEFAKRSASLRYARLELEKVASRPAAIVDAARKHLALLDTRDFAPERFFDQLLQAYQVRLQRIGQPFGTRVDVVDLLGEIAFAMQSPAFFEDPVREKFVPYRRIQMAFDLARLRRSGRLSHRGLRLALGAATGASTRQKANVLYLEDDGGNGQYYLSLRFHAVEAETRSDSSSLP